MAVRFEGRERDLRREDEHESGDDEERPEWKRVPSSATSRDEDRKRDRGAGDERRRDERYRAARLQRETERRGELHVAESHAAPARREIDHQERAARDRRAFEPV